MLKKIILHEMLLNLASFRFLLIVGLFVVLCFGGLAVSIDNYKTAMKEYTEVVAIEPTRATPLNLGIPPNPLGAFAEGTDKSSAIEVSADVSLDDFTVKTLGESDVSMRLAAFDVLDMNFVVKVIMSLAAILITFASVSGERYNGTLKLAAVSGASRKHLMLGKLLASFICLAVPLAICTIISCLILALNNMLLTSMDVVRVCLFMIFSMIYILFFVLVGLIISIYTKRPQESLITGVLCWLVFVFIVPALIPQISKLFVELPSARALEQARLERTHQHFFEWANSGYQESMSNYRERDQAGHDADWEKSRNLFASYASINRWLAMLSPADIYNNASMEIVGNGVQNAIHAKKSILQYKNFVEANRRNLSALGFVFNRMNFASDLIAALASMFVLCLQATVLLLFAYSKFQRLDLREG